MPRLGTRKLYHLLKSKFSDLNLKVGRDSLFSILRSQHMLVKRKKSYTKTTNSKHWLKKHPNLYARNELSRSEEAYVSDITYVKTKDKTVYLSLVTDAWSRKIVGHYLSHDMSTKSVSKAIIQAIKGRKTDKHLIHHSDRGLQYAAYDYQDILNKGRITPSMTDGYDCYQNALAERVNGILKQEFLFYRCNSFEELDNLVTESIKIYNNDRPHLSLDMKTPNEVHKKSCETNLTAQFNL